MKAYSDPDEVKDTTKKYKNLKQLVHERSTQSFDLTDEDLMLQKEKEQQMRKLEQYRMSAYERSNRHVNEKYVKLNNRIEN